MKVSKAKIKKNMIKLASDNPIISSLCHKFDISRATFYRWFNEDEVFREEFNKAKDIGITGICDVAESKIVSLVKGSNEYVALNASKYILEHNSPRYENANPGFMRLKLEEKLRKVENEKKNLIEKTIEAIRVFIYPGREKDNNDKIITDVLDSKSELDK
ncbi:MAG: hypothetical protein US42_C0018G0016 [Candidatus Magasanikbacteria bacterium GW2011_GWC2_37_14]|uniref:Homeodomain phBC6A51-type domain-containing protein n=1 Tax=Candidatus Magasanikbacteria bacterium GW2011_GWC2_37_14 TaxID=1619046 RepID=A0A0G0GAD7_9BACT|nr:MAG: hypothetical protein US42_C0018G0016 [Candidatus Magasanikbacteria bacterium GW2011_GWC2_37_14]